MTGEYLLKILEGNHHLWTQAYADAHLSVTFDQASAHHPEVMERYVVMLEGERDPAARRHIMRCGLRETINERYPISERYGPRRS